MARLARLSRIGALLSVALAVAMPLQAAEELGRDTHRPLPRFVSLKTSEGNVRRGPSLQHRIDWVYHHRDLPLQIVDEYGHWRRVRDIDGQGGWVHYSLLTGARTALVTEEVTLHVRPHETSPAAATAQKGALGRLMACEVDWCLFGADGHRGWLPKTAIWGAEPGETFD